MVCVLYELIELLSTIFGTHRTKVNEFKDRLIAARERAALTQTALGEISDMAGTQISRYESGRAVPRRAVVQRLARALGVSYDWLAKGEGRDKQMHIFFGGSQDGSAELTLRADPVTRENFLALATEAGMSPEGFLGRLVADALQKLATKNEGGPDEESALDKVTKRLEELEARLNEVQSGVPKAEPLNPIRLPLKPKPKP